MKYKKLLGFLLTAITSITLTNSSVNAENLVFTVNSSLSSLKAGGNTSGFDLSEQAPGSNITSYSGTITADITNTTVKIISADLTANIKGNYYPGINGLPYNGIMPAQYGFLYDLVIFAPGYAAMRDLKLNFSQTAPQTLTNGNFNTTSMIVAARAGALDVNLGDLEIAEHISLLGRTGLNAVSSGSLTSTAGSQTLKIPVKVTISYGDMSTLTLTGDITSTRNISIVHGHLPADFNGDCLINNADWEIWRSNFNKGNATIEMGDATGDNFIDAADYTLWKNSENTVPPACLQPANAPADFNGDCVVDGNDRLIWSANYGRIGAYLEMGDADGNGSVDGGDFLTYQRAIGTIPQACITGSASGAAQALSLSEAKTSSTTTLATNSSTLAKQKRGLVESYLKYLNTWLAHLKPKQKRTLGR